MMIQHPINTHKIYQRHFYFFKKISVTFLMKIQIRCLVCVRMRIHVCVVVFSCGGIRCVCYSFQLCVCEHIRTRTHACVLQFSAVVVPGMLHS